MSRCDASLSARYFDTSKQNNRRASGRKAYINAAWILEPIVPDCDAHSSESFRNFSVDVRSDYTQIRRSGFVAAGSLSEMSNVPGGTKEMAIAPHAFSRMPFLSLFLFLFSLLCDVRSHSRTTRWERFFPLLISSFFLVDVSHTRFYNINYTIDIN